MTFETQPCMTCGLHHRNRDFPPACMGAMRTRIGGLESTVKVYEGALGRIMDCADDDPETVWQMWRLAKEALHPAM